MFTRSTLTTLGALLAVLLAAAGFTAAAAAGQVRPDAPTPQQHHVPLVVYGQAS
ncbi:hypothetical protein [Streptacidiphilus neutrinimicus]|uniref:hypothetical protein n=1 Tax=Streptacidiphilus neutrinimicus TaxID=105420 RepID=UPI000AD2564B|nr:hypothetical protein [Streptacidiphilus neutrinimicus]